MICFIAMFVFAVLGIFSAAYRKLAKEAFLCVFKKVTLRKCDTGLDTRIKAKITGNLLKVSPKAGRFVFRHFELLSWLFTLLFIWSIIATAIGGYNYYLYGNCNGPNKDNFCIFDPTGEHSHLSEADTGVCSAAAADPSLLTLEDVDLTLFPTKNKGAKNQVVFIGCYLCPYTREIYPTMQKLMARDDVEFVFAHFPVKGNTDVLTEIGNCVAEQDMDLFWKMNDELFSDTIGGLGPEETALNVVKFSTIDQEKFEACMTSEEAMLLKAQQFTELEKTGIYGTPLVFVNRQPVVGPKPLRVYTRLLK